MLDFKLVESLAPTATLHWQEEVPSTMPIAAKLAREGAPSGTVAGAERQTAGVGRYGRHWHSESSDGLYFTLILRLELPPEQLAIVTLALGMAVQEGILEVTRMQADLRWPNDVLLNGLKCAGILTQLEGSAVLAGIGINVNQREMPLELAATATSIAIASGKQWDREMLLAAILNAAGHWCARLTELSREAILDLFTRQSSYALGRRVSVDVDGRTIEGTTAGLNGNGFLLVDDSRGKRHTILAGGVRPA